MATGVEHGSGQGWEESAHARLHARALHALELYVERGIRMVRSAPPGAVPAMIRTLNELVRLEEGKSTSNVAVSLSPAERRRRIAELAAELYPDALEVRAVEPPPRGNRPLPAR